MCCFVNSVVVMWLLIVLCGLIVAYLCLGDCMGLVVRLGVV